MPAVIGYNASGVRNKNQRRGAFQVNAKDERIIAQRREDLKRRLERNNVERNDRGPMLDDVNLHYEMGERVRAVGCGGIGAMHKMVCRLGLPKAINERLALLKLHLPYRESDHVLNIAYNVLSGGQCLEDIEGLRQDEVYLDALGTQRIPDPTTAGDFTRRFTREAPILALQETINQKRQVLWKRQPASFRKQGIIDIDGTIAGTQGECKEGMDLSYQGIWGYAPLIVSLANTREPLYLVNRPGNTPSHADAARWIDRAIAWVGGVFRKVLLRGDTAFSLTEHFDRWDERVDFIFGYDAYPKLLRLAEALPQGAWQPLLRRPRPPLRTSPRARPQNVKERIVKQREYKNIRLNSEQVAEFAYRPTACQRPYRMVVVRKNLSVERGERRLFDDVRYFFYITNDWDSQAAAIVWGANERCDQENLIAQLKSGIGALRMPTGDLYSNGAYMVMAALAWTLKAWYALLMPRVRDRQRTLRLEFKAFARRYLQIPCQIIRTGRRLVYRIVAYNVHLETFLLTFERIKKLKFV